MEGLGLREVCFSPDGGALALSAAADVVRLVDPSGGREPASFGGAAPLCFSPDGRLLVTATDGMRVVQVWDLGLIRRQLATMGLDW